MRILNKTSTILKLNDNALENMWVAGLTKEWRKIKAMINIVFDIKDVIMKKRGFLIE